MSISSAHDSSYQGSAPRRVRSHTQLAIEYKIALVGAGAVGKSCLTLQYVNNVFVPSYDPTIEDFYRRQCRLDGEPIVMDILDTAGQEEFSVLRGEYLRGNEGFLMVYSSISRDTFASIKTLFDEISMVKEAEAMENESNSSENSKIASVWRCLLVGNKIDLTEDRQVSTEEGAQLAKKLTGTTGWNMPFLETSAKTGHQVEDAFLGIVRLVRDARLKWGLKKPKKNPWCTLL